jgi:hypothetical protein
MQCVNTASPLINIHSRISPRIFEKIRNGPDGPGGNWFMKKTLSLKSRVNLVLDSLEAHACAACSTTAFYYSDFSKLGLRPYTVYVHGALLFVCRLKYTQSITSCRSLPILINKTKIRDTFLLAWVETKREFISFFPVTFPIPPGSFIHEKNFNWDSFPFLIVNK